MLVSVNAFAHVVMRHLTKLIGTRLRGTRNDFRHFWFEQRFE